MSFPLELQDTDGQVVTIQAEDFGIALYPGWLYVVTNGHVQYYPEHVLRRVVVPFGVKSPFIPSEDHDG